MGRPVGVRVPPSAPENARGARVTPRLPFSFSEAPRGLEPARAKTNRREGATFRSASARSRAAKADGADRRGLRGRVPPSASYRFSRGFRPRTGIPLFRKNGMCGCFSPRGRDLPPYFSTWRHLNSRGPLPQFRLCFPQEMSRPRTDYVRRKDEE